MNSDPRGGEGIHPCRSKADIFALLEGDESETMLRVDEVEAGRWLCRGCPALTECLLFALLSDVDGFVAGLTPSELNEVRKAAGIQPPEHRSVTVLDPIDVARAYLRFPDYSLDQMAEHFTVERTTIRRKRKELRDAGIIEWDGEITRVRLDKLKEKSSLTKDQKQRVFARHRAIMHEALGLDQASESA